MAARILSVKIDKTLKKTCHLKIAPNSNSNGPWARNKSTRANNFTKYQFGTFPPNTRSGTLPALKTNKYYDVIA